MYETLGWSVLCLNSVIVLSICLTVHIFIHSRLHLSFSATYSIHRFLTVTIHRYDSNHPTGFDHNNFNVLHHSTKHLRSSNRQETYAPLNTCCHHCSLVWNSVDTVFLYQLNARGKPRLQHACKPILVVRFMQTNSCCSVYLFAHGSVSHQWTRLYCTPAQAVKTWLRTSRMAGNIDTTQQLHDVSYIMFSFFITCSSLGSRLPCPKNSRTHRSMACPENRAHHIRYVAPPHVAVPQWSVEEWMTRVK